MISAKGYKSVIVDTAKEFYRMQERAIKVYSQLQDISSKKKTIMSDMSTFVKISGMKNVVLHRDQDEHGKYRIVVCKGGVKRIRHKKQYGNVMEVSNLLQFLESGSKDLDKLAVRDGAFKLRVECFYKAVVHLPDLRNAYEKFSVARELLKVKFPKLSIDVMDEYEVGKNEIKQLIIHSNGISIQEDANVDLNEYGGYRRNDFDYVNPSHWMALLELHDIIANTLTDVEQRIAVVVAEMDSVIGNIREEFMPVTTLEAL